MPHFKTVSRFAAAAMLFATLGSGLRAGQTPDAPDLVAVHILAIGPNGSPVEDLRAADLTVRLNGRPRPVRSLYYVPMPDAAPEPAAAEPIPPAFSSNSPGVDGRAVLLLVDDESIGPGDERRLRESIDALLDSLTPRDRVGLVTIPHGGARVAFTSDIGAIRQALAALVGRASRQSGLIDLSCVTRQTLEAVAGAASSFRTRGLPMVVVLSGGMVGPRRELDLIGSARAPSACDVKIEDFQAVARAAAASQAHFWVARAETVNLPMAPTEDAAGRSSNLRIGLEQLAGATNAPLLNLTGTDGTVLTRVAAESSGYYVATFEVEPSDRGGAPRRLEMQTSRDGVSVRTPPEIALEATPRSVAPAPVTPASLLTVAAEQRDLPLRVTAYVTRDASGAPRIAVVGEVADPGATIVAAAIGLVDANNRLAGQWQATPADLATRLTAAFAGPPGQYRIRVAAVDAMGRAGTADYIIAAELVQAATLRLSDLILGVTREDGFAPRLVFAREPVATAYVEIYGAQAGANVDALFELTPAAGGPARLRQTATFTPTDEPDRFIATAALPIGALPAGDYIVRATIGLEGQPGARVSRMLRKGSR